jgi:prophage regulatory protein
MRLVRETERRWITGVPTSTCYLLMKQGRFPLPVKLYGTRAVAWVYDELVEWNQSRIDERATPSGDRTGMRNR